MHQLLLSTLNFSILVFIMYKCLKQPTLSFVKGRHLKTKEELEKVEKNLLEAKAKYEEVTSRLKSIESELNAIHQEAIHEAEALKKNILNYAKTAADQIIKDAGVHSQNMLVEFKDQIRTDFVNEVCKNTQNLLDKNLTQEDKVRMRNEFSTQMGATLQ